MDEIKRYRLLIGGVVLLGMIGLAWWAVRARTGDTAPTEAAAAATTLPEIDRDAITEIEIRRPGDEAAIRLVKDGESWRLAAPVEAPAASSNVDTALDKLTDLDVRGVASSNAQFHERLEVDEEHGVRVIARAGGETLIDMWVGAFRGGNTMVRLEGEDRVLMVRGSIKFAFNKPVRDWRDRAILDVEPDSVSSVTFTNDNGTFAFRKGEEAWEQVTEAPEGGEAPPAIERFAPTKVRTSVSSLARLRASDFAGADVTVESAGLGEGAARVVLVAGEGEEARTTTLLVGGEVGEQSRYVMREGDSTIFVVSRFMAERLVPNTEAFQEAEPGEAGAEPPPPDPHGGMPPGGGGQIPPELMQQIQRQLQQQGMGGGGHGH